MKKICPICEQEVTGDQLYYNGELYEINCSTLWAIGYLPIAGHKRCMENINNLIIIPNRYMFCDFIDKELEDIKTDSKSKLNK